VGLNAIAQLLDIPAYPLWSLALFSLDILILFGLAAYGRAPLERERPRSRAPSR
jgi:hypothetical protein